MGFAVVADEVRNLAQRAAASKDTASLMEESVTNATLGIERVIKVGDSIQSFTGNVGRVRTIAEEVAADWGAERRPPSPADTGALVWSLRMPLRAWPPHARRACGA